MSAQDAAAHVAIVAHMDATLALHAASLAERDVLITLAHDERELLTLRAQARWDAILVELTTVGASVEVARRLVEQAPEIPAIVIGDASDAALVTAAFDGGVYDWLPAACPLPLLLAAISRARERRTWRRSDAPASQTSTLPSELTHTINNQIAGLLGLIQLHIGDDALSPDLRADLELMQQSALGIVTLLRSHDQR